MSEEDIKILEEITEDDLLNCWEGGEKEFIAIKHLLKAYKELEKENKELLELRISASAHNRIMELEKENQSYRDYHGTPPCYDNSNYIPVSLVEEKIEYYKELQNNYIKKYDEVNDGLQAMINVLQELLEKRK